MHAKTALNKTILEKNSLLFWLALLTPLAIIPLGINFLLNPLGASTGFGIPITDPAAFPFLWTKGVRDIFSGLVMLPFFLRGDRRAIATMYAAATLIPIGDSFIILRHLGFAAPIFIHWGTALYMAIVTVFLFRKTVS